MFWIKLKIKLKAAGFNLKISPVSGGECLNFESFQAGSDVKSQTFKIPIKLYTRNKKIMVQGTPDCQILFMKYFKEFPAFGHSTPLKTKEVELLQPETKIYEDANTAKSTSKEAESFVLPTTTKFSTPKNSSTTTKFLERSGSFLSPSRIAQIQQTKETVGRLEAEFATFKLSIERRLLERDDNQLFQDKIYSLTQSNNLETKTLRSRINDLEMAKETLSHKVKTLEDQNENQVKQIGKLDGQINTLMSLVTDVFKANIRSDPKPSSQDSKSDDDDEVVINIPTKNRFSSLQPEANGNSEENNQPHL